MLYKKVNFDIIKERIAETYNNEYDVITEKLEDEGHINNNRIDVLHKPCGKTLNVSVKNFLAKERKGRCRCCEDKPVHNNKRLSEADIIARLHEHVGDEYVYVGGYVNTKTKIKLRHETCGNEFEVTPHMFFAKGTRATRCPHCANIKKTEKIREHLNVVHNGDYLQSILDNAFDGHEYEWLEEYNGDNKYKHLIRHKTCGDRALVRPNDFVQGQRCTKCWKSIYEYNIHKTLQELKVKFVKEYLDDNLSEYTTRKNYKFDFAIFLDSGNILLIEYDGVHHDVVNGNTKRRDGIKNMAVERANSTQSDKKYYLIRTSERTVNTLNSLIREFIEEYINK